MELLNKESGSSLPQAFDGRFTFSNPDTEDFTGLWNGNAYTFPAMKTSPFYIVDANPQQTQEIRKQFALKLAQRMFGKSKEYKDLEKKSEGKISPQHYDPAVMLQPYVDMCLKPLPEAKAFVQTKKREEPRLRINPKTGKPTVKVMDGDETGHGESLIEAAEQGLV